MRVKNIAIGIQPLQEGLKDFVGTVRKAGRGQASGKSMRRIFFTSLEAMRRVLTPKRLELLHLIREKHPGSVYELAKLCGRDTKNVQQDVELLSRVELVSLSRRRRTRERLVPHVGYDRLQLQIPVAY